MVVLNPGQVAAYAKAAGFSQSDVAWVVMTTFGESGWNTDAIGYGATYGDPAHNYYGLGQNSDIHKDKFPDFFPPSEKWKDPLLNLTVMKAIFDKQGKTAFSGRPERQGSTGGSVSGQATMAAAEVAGLNNRDNLLSYAGYNLSKLSDFEKWWAKTALGAVQIAGDGPSGTPLDNANAQALGSAANSVGELLNGDTFTKIAWVAGGSLMVILGLLLLFKSQTPVGKIASVFK